MAAPAAAMLQWTKIACSADTSEVLSFHKLALLTLPFAGEGDTADPFSGLSLFAEASLTARC